MLATRYIRSQLLWSGDDIEWPSLGEGAHVAFLSDNTLGVRNTDFTPDMFLAVDNPDNLDYCLIELAGEVSDITTIGAPAGQSLSRSAVIGLPFAGDTTDDEFLSTHPLLEQTQAYAKGKSYVMDAVGMPSFDTNPTPPYFGYIHNTGMSIEAQEQGFPFFGGTIADGDRFHFIFPIGNIGVDSVSISGFRKLWLAYKSVNPALVVDTPSQFSITARMWAHLYEFRER
jgi:hypothetical protein